MTGATEGRSGVVPLFTGFTGTALVLIVITRRRLGYDTYLRERKALAA